MERHRRSAGHTETVFLVPIDRVLTCDSPHCVKTFAKLFKTSIYVIPVKAGSVSGAGAGIHPTAVIPAKAGI